MAELKQRHWQHGWRAVWLILRWELPVLRRRMLNG